MSMNEASETSITYTSSRQGPLHSTGTETSIHLNPELDLWPEAVKRKQNTVMKL
jgi:hypothetical protein